jgi:hypothetical protein
MLLVIVNNFHFECMWRFPSKTDPILIVNPNAVLPVAIALKARQMMTGESQIRQCFGGIEVRQLSADSAFNQLIELGRPIVKELLRLSVAEGADHISSVYRYTTSLRY